MRREFGDGTNVKRGRQNVASKGNENPANLWRARWPNPAESSFNYYRFLESFEQFKNRSAQI